MKNFKHLDMIRKHGDDILSSKGMEIEKECIQHGIYSVYDHSLFVTSMCIRISRRLKIRVNEKAMVRGALLHDYFLYDWHTPCKANRIHGFTHPGIALRNAEKEFILGEIEKNMIKRHMFPLTPVPPKYREGVILCIADKICALYETVGGFKIKLSKLRFKKVKGQ